MATMQTRAPTTWEEVLRKTRRVNLRVLRRATALALLVLPCDLGAQVGSAALDDRPTRESMRLSAAIEEIRKSPFHASPWSAGELEGDPLYPMELLLVSPLYRMELFSASVAGSGSLRYQEASGDTVVSSARVFVATWSIGLFGYLGGGLIFAARPSDNSLLLGASLPIAAVGLAAWGAGADPGRAAIGSILGGAIGIPLAFADPVIGITVGVVAHAAVTTLASKIHFRRRPRS